MDPVVLGKFISQMRKEQGLSQVELANRLHVSNRTVSKWETGAGLPDISLLIPLSKELNITVQELMTTQKETAVRLESLQEISEFGHGIEETIAVAESSKKAYVRRVRLFLLGMGVLIALILAVLLVPRVSEIENHFYMIRINKGTASSGAKERSITVGYQVHADIYKEQYLLWGEVIAGQITIFDPSGTQKITLAIKSAGDSSRRNASMPEGERVHSFILASEEWEGMAFLSGDYRKLAIRLESTFTDRGPEMYRFIGYDDVDYQFESIYDMFRVWIEESE